VGGDYPVGERQILAALTPRVGATLGKAFPAARLASLEVRPVNWIALRMLSGDRAKYLSLIFGVTFATLLMAPGAGFRGRIGFCLVPGLVRTYATEAHTPVLR
jgi:hypothetical protein